MNKVRNDEFVCHIQFYANIITFSCEKWLNNIGGDNEQAGIIVPLAVHFEKKT